MHNKEVDSLVTIKYFACKAIKPFRLKRDGSAFEVQAGQNLAYHPLKRRLGRVLDVLEERAKCELCCSLGLHFGPSAQRDFPIAKRGEHGSQHVTPSCSIQNHGEDPRIPYSLGEKHTNKLVRSARKKPSNCETLTLKTPQYQGLSGVKIRSCGGCHNTGATPPCIV